MIFNNSLNEITINKINDFEIKETSKNLDNEKAVIFCNIVTTSLNLSDGEVVRVNLKPCFVSDGKITRVRKSISGWL